LEQVKEEKFIQDLKMDILQAIQFIIKSWSEITAKTVYNCWHHTKILSNIDIDMNNPMEINDSELIKLIDTLNFPNAMETDEFLNIPDKDVIYEVSEENKIIAELVDVFQKKSHLEEFDETDDSIETPVISANVALESLKNIQLFLFQQENARNQLKLIDNLEKFIREKKFNSTQQVSLDKYYK
jgi:hypothetical protein